MIYQITFLLLLILLSNSAWSNDFFVMDSKLDQSVGQLKNESSLPENNIYYQTPLGVKSRCFVGKHYLVLSTNDLGKGYELTYIAPEGVQCVKMNEELIQNRVGIHLGMNKNKVLQLLNLASPSNRATLLYNQQKIIDNVLKDEQIWIDFEFQKEKLQYFKIFVSLTE